MNVRRFSLLLGLVTMIATGVYVFVYLYRWEWNRAIIAGILFLTAEIAVATLVIAWQIARRHPTETYRTGGIGPGASTRRSHLRAARPGSEEPFAWLTRRDGDLGVFIPVLLGAGLAFSTLAWVLERIARATADPHLERNLANRLDEIAPPDGGFLTEDHAARVLWTPYDHET